MRWGSGTPLVLAATLLTCADSRPPTDVAMNDAAMDGDATVTAPLPSLDPDATETRTCSTTPPTDGAARAHHIVCDAELASGPLAMGRIGDVVLENARVRYIVRAGPEAASLLGASGGGLIDATLQTERRDGLKEALGLLNAFGLAGGDLVVVRADGQLATVRTAFAPRAVALLAATIPGVFQRPRVRGVLEYELRGDDDALHARVCAVTDTGTGSVEVPLGIYLGLGGAFEVVASGTGVLTDMAISATPTIVLAESPVLGYGVRMDAPPMTALHTDSINLFVATNPFAFQGRSVECTGYRFVAAPTAAHAFAALSRPGGTQRVNVTVPAGGRAEILDPAGHIVLRSRETAGRVDVALPAGTYTSRVARAGGLFGDPAAPPATATLVARPSVRGEPAAPVRIAVRSLDRADEQFRWVLTAEGRRSLPPGMYRVSASRGVEYTADARDLMLAPDVDTVYEPVLDRVVDTAGYVSTDFHLHTELSGDSTHPVENAVRQMAAEGLEVVASTDHDFIADHAVIAARSDVSGWIVAVPGDEVSTTRLGHFGGYPLRRDVARSGAGAVLWPGMTPTQVFQSLRASGDDVVVQVNHPYLRGGGFFERIMLNPATGVATADPASLGFPAGTNLSDLSFEVIEVWNGYTRGGNEQAFTTFVSLLAAGRRFVMVGNSDSHQPDLPPGAPRSFVRVPDDARGHFAWNDVRAGLRAGDVSISAGLFLDVRASDGTRPGGTLRVSGGSATVHIRVQGAPWADFTRLRVFRGTEVVVERAITTPRDQVVRFDEDVVVPVTAAGFIVVRADGVAPAEPLFSWPTFAATNPLWVRTD